MKLNFVPVRFSQRILLGFSVLILFFLSVMIGVELVGIPGTANKGNLERFRTRILSDMEVVSGLLSQRIAGWQRERRSDLDGLAASPSFCRLVERQSAQTGRDLARELDAFRTSQPDIESLALLDPGGTSVLAASGGFAAAANAAAIGIGSEQSARLTHPGYRETVDIYHAPDRTPRLRIMRQVFSTATPDQLSGLLVAECDIERAVRARIWSVSNLVSRDWQCVVAGKSGGSVTQFSDTRTGRAEPREVASDLSAFTPVRLAMSGIEGPYDGPDQHGEPVLAFYRQVRFDQGIALALVLMTDRGRALHPASVELWQRCILWLFMFTAGIGLCMFLSKQISRPINELVAVARRIEAGDLTGRVAAPGASELGRFAAVFNGMVDHIEMSHQDLERQVQDRTRDLRQLSARQEAILTAAPDIIVEADTEQVYTWSNRAGFEFFGEDFLGQPVAAYVVGEANISTLFQASADGAAKANYVENWQRRKDGEVRLLAWWSSELKDEHGRVTRVISTARDITERKQAEEALQREYAELERFNRVTLGRELRMIELKKEINTLLNAAGQPAKYRIVSDPP